VNTIFVNCPKHDRVEVMSEREAVRLIETFCRDDSFSSGRQDLTLCPVELVEEL
jgi:hypothetical protein